MAKYNFYAVGHGIDPNTGELVTDKICKSWDECQKFIKGVSNVRYKGFLTMSEAKEWLKQFNNDDNNDIHTVLNDLEKLINIDKSNNKNNKINNVIDNVNKDFLITCNKIGVDSNVILNMLKKQFIETYSLVIDIKMNVDELPFK